MAARGWRNFDYILLVATLGLICYGVMMIYSATYQTQGQESVDPLVYRHLGNVAAAMVIFIGLSLVDFHFLGTFAYASFGVALALLAFVLIFGQSEHGGQRWINLGFYLLQPSEPAKIAVILALAKFISSRETELQSVRAVGISLLIVGVPTALTLVQPDLGTSLVFIVVWIAVAIVGRIRWRYLILLGVSLAAAVPAIWSFLLRDYQRERLITFMDPSRDPLGAGYNVIQALIGVGSGGLLGRGFLSGTQSQLHFLRVQYADFIFSVLAEELGFVGAVVLLALFAILVLRGMGVAGRSQESFGRLAATGVVTMIAFQVFVNVGMNSSLLPATGIPLPFISYGGSSLISVMAGLGLVESIAIRRGRPEA